jgi:hypothetical protein
MPCYSYMEVNNDRDINRCGQQSQLITFPFESLLFSIIKYLPPTIIF